MIKKKKKFAFEDYKRNGLATVNLFNVKNITCDASF